MLLRRLPSGNHLVDWLPEAGRLSDAMRLVKVRPAELLALAADRKAAFTEAGGRRCTGNFGQVGTI